MTNVKDLSWDDLVAQASTSVPADDDMGISLRREAVLEYDRRTAEIKAFEERVRYPKGRPLAPLEVRLANVLNSVYGSSITSTHSVIDKIKTEIARKNVSDGD